MKKEFALTLLGCSGVLFLTAGCAPELAQVPVGQEEKNWDKVLKQNYYSFRPPHTPAPASYQPQTQAPKPVEQQDLPEAVEDPAAAVDRAASGDKAVTPAAEVNNTPAAEVKTVPAAEVKTAPKAEAAKVAEADKKAEQKAENTTSEFTKPYIVQSGDSLGKIALKFYGKSSMSDMILKANSNVLSDPKKLRPGMKLVIPEL